jgi:hypothetical protein
MGVPPPPGSTCDPVGASELASRLGAVEATAEVETEHAAAVLGTIRLDHLPKTNLAELGRPKESASCKTAFAMTSPTCRAAVGAGPWRLGCSSAPAHRRDPALDVALPDALSGLEGVNGFTDPDGPGGSAVPGAVVARHHPTTVGPLHDLGVMHLPQWRGPPAADPSDGANANDGTWW